MRILQTIIFAAAYFQLLLVFGARIATASTVEVTVVDRDARPVSGVAVYWRANHDQEIAAPPGTRAVMDQVDRQFVPHLLIVQTGTLVEFPNSDIIAHHVYSFSHPNQFKLPIYKGDAHPPVMLSESGVVILGCNIHDNMLGYILVVDTPVFDKTDENGIAMLETAEGEGQVAIWSPRIRDDQNTLTMSLDPPVDGEAIVAFQLRKALRPAFDEKTEALTWAEY